MNTKAKLNHRGIKFTLSTLRSVPKAGPYDPQFFQELKKEMRCPHRHRNSLLDTHSFYPDFQKVS